TPSTWRVRSVTPSCRSSRATRWRNRLIGSPSLSAAERKLPCSITCRNAWTFSQLGCGRRDALVGGLGGPSPRRRVCIDAVPPELLPVNCVSSRLLTLSGHSRFEDPEHGLRADAR